MKWLSEYVKRAPTFAHLLAIPAFLGLLYLSWTYVSSKVDLDFPPNTMGAAMVLPLKVIISVIMVGVGVTLFKFLAIDLPRSIRRHSFWKRKRVTDTRPEQTLNDNGDWIRPLLSAFILTVAPWLALTFGGIHSDYLMPLCSIAALVALVIAGVKARMTDTLLAKIVSHLAVLACLFVLGVQFFHSVG